jgi:hypothetical protein
MILYDVLQGRRVTAAATISREQIRLGYQSSPTWDIKFVSVDMDEGTVTDLDVSDAVAWKAAVDDDFDHDSDPMCRTLNVDIDSSLAADGIISPRLDAATATFLAAVGESETIRAWFELQGLDGAGAVIYEARFEVVATNALDPSGGTPPDPVGDYYTKTETDVLLTAYQPLDAGLTSIAGLTTAADQMPYLTGPDTYATAPLTAAGRALLDDANAAAQLATLGIPLLATSGITGILTLSKAGTTARTATFPDAAITVAGSAAALPADRIVASTTGGLLQALDTATYPSLTELSYVKGVTSAIQTQIGTKVGTAANLTNVGRMVRVSAAGTIGETDISVGAADGVISRAGEIRLSATGANILAVYTAGAKRLSVDENGVLSLRKATPSAWSASFAAVDIGGNCGAMATAAEAAGAQLHIVNNVYFDGAWKRISADEVSSYRQNDGTHVFRVAASGTAGSTVTWTDAATINSTGQLLIGITTPIGLEAVRVALGTIATAGATDVLFGGGSISLGANLGIGVGAWGANAAKVIGIGNGTAPGNAADMVQLYAADQTAGNSCLHLRTENGAVLKLYQQAEITDELTTITHTAPGAPDYAIQDLTDSGGFGFATKDEGNSVLAVIANLQARVNELETTLVNMGFLVDAD